MDTVMINWFYSIKILNDAQTRLSGSKKTAECDIVVVGLSNTPNVDHTELCMCTNPIIINSALFCKIVLRFYEISLIEWMMAQRAYS